jgi:hypothetical protein
MPKQLRVFRFLEGAAALLLLAGPVWAGPLEFGLAEFKRAVAERGLGAIDMNTSVSNAPAESYSVRPGRITGGDERGVMYGLLDAAEQIRATGTVAASQGSPAVAVRGIRMLLHNEDLEKDWYYSREHWDRYFAMLARNRFNRFNLVFAHQTDYLAPPYPFWLDLKEFPEIRAKKLTDAQRKLNLEMLKYISDTAAGHGVDFILGVWEHNIQTYRTSLQHVSSVDGLTRENIGPYSHAALKQILRLCPSIRGVQLRTNRESGIPNDQQLEFFRDSIFTAMNEAGRTVALDLRAWTMAPGLLEAAVKSGLPMRLSTKYWAEFMGRPYQPADTFPRYSYMTFLEKPRRYEFLWEIWRLGSHRVLLWSDPDYVKRTVSTFGLGGAAGFEIDAPLSQKGYGNKPGKWGIFSDTQQKRVFWKYEFERYWAFYQLWGQLSYNPAVSDSLYRAELRRRFGPAAEDVDQALRSASKVISEIVAAHLADPNMYIWPEVNPGGLIGAYKDVLPSDWRHIARVQESVRTRLDKAASAKQSPLDTAALLDRLAAQTEAALARARKMVDASNAEWLSSEIDMQVLAALARYHARKQKAAYDLTWFYETGNLDAIRAARSELKEGLVIWTDLVRLTDGVYPGQMAYGPADIGVWKDKLPYVQHDVAWIEELEKTAARFGQNDYRFDFGGPPGEPADVPYRDYRDGHFIRNNTVEPRFQLAEATSPYSETAGYGWAGAGKRSVSAVPLTPYPEAAAVAAHPKQLPHNVLLGDYVEGSGAQTFRVRTGDGSFEATLVAPDGSSTQQVVRAAQGVVDVTFPQGSWQVAALLLRNADGNPPRPAPVEVPKTLPRPKIIHSSPPESAVEGRPLKLTVQVEPASNVTGIRIHYRGLNYQEEFHKIETFGVRGSFTIPGEHISARWDLIYYFEVLNTERTGWFHPDPLAATPYYVVKVAPAGGR